MTGVTHSRPLRFFTMVMLGWIAVRLIGQDAKPPAPPIAEGQATQPTPMRSPLPVQAAFASAAVAGATMPAPSASPLPSLWVPSPVRVTRARTPLSTKPYSSDTADPPGDLMAFTHSIMEFANRHYASDTDYGSFQPTAAPSPPARATSDRWRAGSWLLWRPGGPTNVNTIAQGRLGGSQAGLRVEYELTPRASSRTVAYGRVTSALQRPAAPEAAVGVSIQPFRAIPVSLAAERRIALGQDGRNANAVMAVGGFGPSAIAPSIAAEGYAQAGIVGFRRGDMFIDGKLSLLSPIDRTSVRIGAALSGGAQPGVNRVDIGPELQVRLPLPKVAARVAVEWRQRIAGNARPGSGLAITLAADF